MEEIQLNYPAT